MRAKEFISEDQKLDEGLFLPFLYAGGIAWQGIETYNDIQDYKSGKIDGAELGKRIGLDAAAAVAGGVAGRGLSLGWNALKSAMKFKGAGKEALDTTKDAIKQAQKAPKPGSTIQTPKGPRVAGVDGKPTTINPTKRGARADIKKIKQAAKDPKNKAAGKTGAVAGAVAKKGDDVAKVGTSAASIGSKAKKLIPGKAARRGALAGVYANQTNDFIDDMGGFGGSGSASSTAGKNIAGLGGDLVYTGTETNPEVVRIKGVNDPMPYMTKPSPYKTDPLTGKPKQPTTNDSNSPVPTAKDPKLPKQDTTSLATQQGVK